MVSVNSPSTQALSEADLQTHESGARRPKILWPAANEKTKYKVLEDKVLNIVREERKNETGEWGAKEWLGRFTEIIYETASEEFGCKEMKKKTTEKSKGVSRRQRELAQIRKQKKELQKRKKNAPQEEQEGLGHLFEELKKKEQSFTKKGTETDQKEGEQASTRRIFEEPIWNC